jgi:uncharacterized protein YraI
MLVCHLWYRCFILLLAVAIMSSLSIPLPASAHPHTQADPPTATVVVRGLNIRSGPGTQYDRVGSVKQGDQLIILGQSNNCAWLAIRTPQNLEGWVAGSPRYVTYTVTCAAIPVATPKATAIATTTPPQTKTPTPPAAEKVITIYESELGAGLELNVDNEQHKYGWIQEEGEALQIDFLPNQAWAVVFITVGPPKPAGQRSKIMDLSACNALSFDLHAGQPDVSIRVGIKDSQDPDNGSETLISVPLSQTRREYTLPLSQFVSADLKNIFLPFELVHLDKKAVTVFVHRVRVLC